MKPENLNNDAAFAAAVRAADAYRADAAAHLRHRECT